MIGVDQGDAGGAALLLQPFPSLLRPLQEGPPVQHAGQSIGIGQQAQALAAQVMSEPGQAYAYRRRRYRRLLAQDRDLRNLLWLLGLALPLREQDARAEAFRVLEQRLGFSPPSRQEAAALRKHLGPGDAAAYHLSLQTCTCAVCAQMRTGAAPHDDALAEALEACPCGVCFAFRKLSERAAPVLQAYGRRLGFTMSGFLALLGAKNVN